MRDILGNFRVRHKFPTRRKKERPTMLTLKNWINDDISETIEVEPQNYPSILLLPKFGSPGILDGKAPNGQIVVGAWSGRRESNHNHRGRYQPKPFKADTFTLMLAKIAHSFVYANIELIELQKYNQLLPDYILAKKPKLFGYLVGGSMKDTKPAPENILHEISLSRMTKNGVEFLLVNIQLFANWGAPQYYAVFGHKPVNS
ncbi:MAG: hypothetical protein QM488_02365 [Rhizobiaceae bacterium]